MTEVQTDEIIRDERISAYGRLVETQRRLHRIFDRSLREKAGMSIVWYEALLRLARSSEGHLTINDLGEALELTSGGATRLVDRLEESGYANRVACPTDRRVWWVAPTEIGREALTKATQIHLDDLEKHFVSQLDRDEIQTLNDYLTRLRASDEDLTQLPDRRASAG